MSPFGLLSKLLLVWRQSVRAKGGSEGGCSRNRSAAASGAAPARSLAVQPCVAAAIVVQVPACSSAPATNPLAAGLILDSALGSDGQTTFVRVSATEARLLREAQHVGEPCQLDSAALRDADIRVNDRLQSAGVTFGLGEPVRPPPCCGLLSCCRCCRALEACPQCCGSRGVAVTAPMGPALPPKLPRHQLAIPKLGTRNPCRACVPRLLADILCPLPLDPYSHIYAPLVAEGSPSDPRTSLYYVHKTTGSVLSNSAALRMLVSILEGPTADGGAGAGSLGRLQSSGRLTGWFPGRLVGKEAKLARSWGALVPLCCQPLDQVHSLFGSKVALHFALIAFIASVLVLPALVGAAAFVHQLVVVSPSKVAWAPLFALMVIMLLGVATKLWRRREKRLAMRWGLLNARKKPLLRSEVKQPHRRRRSPITGRPSYLQSARERSTRSCCAASCTATAMGVVVVVTLSTFLARVALGSLEQQGLIEPSWSGYASSVIGAVVVTVTQLLYSRMAVCLTNWENRPTDVEHDASLICKQGVFNAVNVSPTPALPLWRRTARVAPCATAPPFPHATVLLLPWSLSRPPAFLGPPFPNRAGARVNIQAALPASSLSLWRLVARRCRLHSCGQPLRKRARPSSSAGASSRALRGRTARPTAWCSSRRKWRRCFSPNLFWATSPKSCSPG